MRFAVLWPITAPHCKRRPGFRIQSAAAFSFQPSESAQIVLYNRAQNEADKTGSSMHMQHEDMATEGLA
jgi:hypothetical protein